MRIAPDDMPGLAVLEPRRFPDERGWVQQAWVASTLAAAGIPAEFRQSLLSSSRRGVVRGLHFQWAPPQGKLVRCVHGAVLDVVVDVRRGSPTFGKWDGVELSAENHRQLWIPPGFAHGFLVLSAVADFLYKTTDYYSPADERAMRWDDPDIGIRWPLATLPGLSHRDAAAPLLRETAAFPL